MAISAGAEIWAAVACQAYCSRESVADLSMGLIVNVHFDSRQLFGRIRNSGNLRLNFVEPAHIVASSGVRTIASGLHRTRAVLLHWESQVARSL